MKILKEVFLEPLNKLDEEEVRIESTAMFLAHYLNILLSGIPDQEVKERIIKRFLDGNNDGSISKFR